MSGVGRVVGLAIVGGVVAGILTGVIGTTVQQALRPPSSYAPVTPSGGDESPLVEGPPGSPIAVEPTVCPEECFDLTSVEAATLEDAVFDAVELEDHWTPTHGAEVADEAHREAHAQFTDYGWGPPECFVTWSQQPVVEPEGAAVGPDPLVAMGDHWSFGEYDTGLSQSARLFADSATAEAYMATLSTGIAGCPAYTNAGYDADVITPEADIAPPPAVAAVGFVREVYPGIRYYVMDIQRGNLVIRTSVYSDGGIDERSFRLVMTQQADRVAGLVPVGAEPVS